MNYAIIAAGEGSRLVEEGIKQPKPLVKLNGIPLIDRLIDIFIKNNAESISIIVNNEMKEVQSHIASLQSTIPVPLNVVIKSTSSSMHSFFELSRFLQAGKFCLTTVDTIFKEDEFAQFIQAFIADTETDGMMAVTDYIDDEKPLYISVGADMNITGFFDTFDSSAETPQYVSGGIYCLSAKALTTLDYCMKNGFSKMRNFQRQLITDGLNLKAFPFKKIIDLDHAEDIAKAEFFLSQTCPLGQHINNRMQAQRSLRIPRSSLRTQTLHSLQTTQHSLQTQRSLRIAGIRRDHQYSPNNIDNDAAIFDLVAEHLTKSGHEVTTYSEEEFLQSTIDADVIFNMARYKQSIEKLQQLEDKGILVINSGYGIENCMREKMTRLLASNNIPYPESIIVSTNQSVSAEHEKLISNCWIKRGDFHAIYREDVAYVGNREETERVLNEYSLRNIDTAVISEHIKGDLIKFYGVAGTPFFHWFYSDEQNHSKFGLETINGKPIGNKFDVSYLINICNRAAEVLNVHIYGGDCVVDSQGNMKIIDFNDWPSFAPCRTEAASYITQCIDDKIKEKNKPTLESSLKSFDTEEFIDMHFYRPMGYRWALLFKKKGITPNQITIASIFIGMAAGMCYYFDNIWINVLGIFLLIWANSYDSADGQLARMTRQKSEFGRVLDGVGGYFWFISIYFAIVFRLQSEWGWWIFALALVAGYSHALQAGMADYYRSIHLFFLKGKLESELQNSKDLTGKCKNLSWRKNTFVKLFETLYIVYTKTQERRTPHLQEMLKILSEKYPVQVPDWFCSEFREESLPLMKYTNILTFNTRSIVLFISLLIGIPWFYFVFELTILNIILIYMVSLHENICKKFAYKLSKETC